MEVKKILHVNLVHPSKNLHLQNSESLGFQEPESPIDKVEVISFPIWRATIADSDIDIIPVVIDSVPPKPYEIIENRSNSRNK